MPIHQPFTRLPVWLRRVLTLLAVVLLASLLTHWRQNASTYATGFWDTGSQPLVFGRMLQMENHQSAPGGFMGVYTQEWSDGQNRTWFRKTRRSTPRISRPTPTNPACRAGHSGCLTARFVWYSPAARRGRPGCTP